MRPRKKILLWYGDQFQSSILKFILETAGYRAIECDTPLEAIGKMEEIPFDLLILSRRPGADKIVLSAKDHHCPSILMARKREIDCGIPADAVFPYNVQIFELLERVRILCAHKRGPRKQAAA